MAARSCGSTTTVNWRLAVNGGEPWSSTMTVKWLVVETGAGVGVQVNQPVLASIVGPGGLPSAGPPLEETNEYVSSWAGKSASLAITPKATGVPSETVQSLTGASTGGMFTSTTKTVNCTASLSVGWESSDTRTATAYVPGPCTSVGVQLISPVDGSMVIPSGAPGSRLKVSNEPSKSGSVAALVTSSRLPSLIARLSRGASTGALFTSLTATEKVCVALKLGEPLSATRTEIV